MGESIIISVIIWIFGLVLWGILLLGIDRINKNLQKVIDHLDTLITVLYAMKKKKNENTLEDF
jgi:hypothetical protein